MQRVSLHGRIDSAVNNPHKRSGEAEKFNVQFVRPANRQPHRSPFVRRVNDE